MVQSFGRNCFVELQYIAVPGIGFELVYFIAPDVIYFYERTNPRHIRTQRNNQFDCHCYCRKEGKLLLKQNLCVNEEVPLSSPHHHHPQNHYQHHRRRKQTHKRQKQERISHTHTHPLTIQQQQKKSSKEKNRGKLAKSRQ